MIDKVLFGVLLCVTMTMQHRNQAYPPGVPPPASQHVHAAQQPPTNQQYQQQQGQQYQGQNQQYQGQPPQGQNQQYQGQNQQYQGQPPQGQNQQYQGQPPQGQNQQYQGQPPQQGQQNLQYQQGQGGGQQQQYQGQPPQGGQQNTQQFQQQQQQQQPPPAHDHHGFNQRENVHNSEHIKEHLKDVVDKPEKEMTDDELEFHYFKLHDYDGNNKLDGVEVTKAITHFHEEDEGGEHKEPKTPPKVYTDEELINIIDMVMKEDDLNDDGYIEYFEFVTAQRKAREDTGDKKN